jgi:hypothetical protein
VIRRLAAAAIAAAAVTLVAAAPAAALENADFGISPAEGGLAVTLHAGETATLALRVWSKADQPIDLVVDVEPASFDESGNARLGGDPAAAGWIDVVPRRVLLAPGERRTVEINLTGPRQLDDGRHAAAVVLHTQPADAGAAVVQRLAQIVSITTVASTASPGLGPLPWLAALLAASVAGRAGVQARRERSARREAGRLVAA